MEVTKGKCGTYCNTCGFREEFKCKGCSEVEGKPFWGECSIYQCATDKGFKHCGDCSKLPCHELQDFIENGHNPDRLSNLKKWKNED